MISEIPVNATGPAWEPTCALDKYLFLMKDSEGHAFQVKDMATICAHRWNCAYAFDTLGYRVMVMFHRSTSQASAFDMLWRLLDNENRRVSFSTISEINEEVEVERDEN